MNPNSNPHHRSLLTNIARQAMRERNLLPDFSPAVLAQLLHIEHPAIPLRHMMVDLRHLPWCSIDNDDSKDLDQLTVAQLQTDEFVKILVAIADVDALVKKGTPIDAHAHTNTTSIYTAAALFPMLPLKLSTDLTSLNLDNDRAAVVMEMDITLEGKMKSSRIFRALVHNHAKLTYNSVAAWLEQRAPIPPAVARVKTLTENLLLQDHVAQLLRKNRHEHGALELQTIQTRPIFQEERIFDLEVDLKNRAKELIEDFMVAANTVTANFLKQRAIPSIRRVVRTPKRWERIRQTAALLHTELPPLPDATALAQFLHHQKSVDPLRFPDLSLAIIKLLGRGEYVVERPGEEAIGHFGLAVEDYTHSTAPNRRYPDLITQRMVKATLQEEGPLTAYSPTELEELATHCTVQEDAATKVERRVAKSAGALLLSTRIGETFDAICTGAAEKGTWVRIFHPAIEGRLVRSFAGVDVGDRLQVKLIHTDVERGFIDFTA